MVANPFTHHSIIHPHISSGLLARCYNISSHCDGFEYKSKIGKSLYFHIKKRRINLKNHFTVPAHERRQCKLRQARAVKGFFVGYSYSKFLQSCYRVVTQFANGTYGRLRITKDVIFDLTIITKSELETDLPTSEKFDRFPSLELVHDQDNANAFRRQLIILSAIHYDKCVTEMGCKNIP